MSRTLEELVDDLIKKAEAHRDEWLSEHKDDQVPELKYVNLTLDENGRIVDWPIKEDVR